MPKLKNGGLGRGLGSILPDIEQLEVGKAAADNVSMVPLDKVAPNPFQPRKEFDGEALDELTQSIRQQGVITPVTVRRMPDGSYQLVAGERRTRANTSPELALEAFFLQLRAALRQENESDR